MSLSPKPTPTARTGRSLSSAGQACRECRRRKGKCDGKLPVCSVCNRYRRHCLYDKHSRSALTRKHLTEVEERLERAEALLRTLFTEPELSQVLAQGYPPLEASQNVSAETSKATDEVFPLPAGQTPASGQSFGPGAPPADVPFASAVQASNAVDQTSLLHESAPSAADDDFEWDERESLWSSHDPGARLASITGSVEATLPQIADGMATLSTNDQNTGFLGSVSGAALLRVISESRSEVKTSGELPALAEERRNSVAEFLALQPDEATSSGSWLRAQPIMTRAFVDTLVDSYFAHYHPTFPILHEATFREQYQTLSNRPKGTWHILANLVAALGSFVSSTCSDDTDINLFNAVKSQLTIEALEAGSLGLVQAFAMAANYLQKRNRPNSGYNYGGVALRLAISLGLYKEFLEWQTTPLRKEIRRRVWWSLCVLDVGATVTYGRPLNWPQVGVEAIFPLNIHEEALKSSATSFPREVDDTTVYSYVRTQSAYHLSTIQIYNRLISSPIPSAGELIQLDDELIEGWRKSLPSYFCDDDLSLAPRYLLGHAISRWRFRIMRIVMYRPFLLRWAQDGFRPFSISASPTSQSLTSEEVAVTRCFHAAEDCISILYRFWSTATHTRLAAWYVLYFLLQATLIPVYCLRRNPAHLQAPSWVAQVRTALQIINPMVNINPSAQKCRDIIYRLCGDTLGRSSLPQQRIPVTSEDTFDFGFSTSHPNDPNIDSWMTEIDTAIDGYDMYCDRLTNVAAAGMAGQATVGGNEQDFTNSGPFAVSNWGTEIGTGQDWDWGLML